MTNLDPTLLPALNAIERALERKPQPIDRRQLLNSMQKLDYDMRLRHYPAVFDQPEQEPRWQDERSYEQFGEEQQGYHGSDRR